MPLTTIHIVHIKSNDGNKICAAMILERDTGLVSFLGSTIAPSLVDSCGETF